MRFESDLEALVLRTSFGLGALGTACLALGLLHVLSFWPVLTVAAISLLLATIFRRDVFRIRLEGEAAIETCVVLAFASLAFLLTLYPPASWDDTMYHLPYAKAFAKSGALPYLPQLRYPVFPQQWEMLYTAALLFRSDCAAQAVHLLATILVGLGTLTFARRFLSPAGGWIAATVWLGSPTVLMIGTAAYIDSGIALFALMSLYGLEAWRRTEERGWLLTAMSFAAFAAGTKYFGLFFLFGIPVAALAFRGRRAVRPLIVGALIALAIAGPWYARNAVLTENPVFPFFMKTDLLTPDIADDGGQRQRIGFGPMKRLIKEAPELWRLPWDLAFHPTMFGELEPFSPAVPLLLLLAIAYGTASKRARPWAALPLLYFAIWLVLLRDRRFLFPALPILLLAGSEPLVLMVRRWRWIAAVASLAALVPGLLYVQRMLEWRGRVPIGEVERGRYVSRVYPFYPALDYLNKAHGERYAVFAVRMEQGQYYAEGTMWGDHFGRGSYRRVLTGDTLRDGATVRSVMARLKARFLLVNSSRRAVLLPHDPDFDAHFTAVFARPRVQLYELSDSPLRRVAGPNLVVNSSFDREGAWHSHLDCQFASDAVRCAGDANLSQQIRVEPGAYEISLRTRADAPGQQVRLQVNWSDAAGGHMSADIEVVDATAQWKTHSMLVTVPDGAATASVYVQTHAASAAWFDDISLRRIASVPAGEAPQNAPRSTAVAGR